MKRTALTVLCLLLCLCLAACGTAPEDDGTEALTPPVSGGTHAGTPDSKDAGADSAEETPPAAVDALRADAVTGTLPVCFAVPGGDQSADACLLAGFFRQNGGKTVFYSQLSPALGPSGFGSLTAAVALPDDSGTLRCAALQPEQTRNPPETEVFAFFAPDGLPDAGSVNLPWKKGVDTPYVYPVCVCRDDGGTYLLSLTAGDVFRPEKPLPEAAAALAGGAPEDGGTAPAGQCGVAVFSILAQEDDGAYTVALTRFLTLGS